MYNHACNIKLQINVKIKERSLPFILPYANVLMTFNIS